MENKRTSKRYEINGGGVLCDLNSVSGDMHIVGAEGTEQRWESSAAAEPESAPAVAETHPGEDSQTRMDILKAIASGELTVDEGLSRLQDLPFEE